MSVFYIVVLAAAAALTGPAAADCTAGLRIARLQYDGGGDWYSDPSSLPNLLRFVAAHTRIETCTEEAVVKAQDEELFTYPYLYLTGHGNITFAPEDAVRLRRYLESGGFLHADDNYGMDDSFRREMKKVFPKKEWVELPPDHEIFRCHFILEGGLPKIHEHDGKRPQLFGLFDGQRLVATYSYEADLGDGWEDPQVHTDPPAARRAALEMGTNLIVWALTH